MSYGYLHLAKIVSYDDVKKGYYLESVALARTSRWGPCPSLVPGLLTGDRVILGATGTSRDNLVVLGKVGAEFPAIGDIPGLSALLNVRKSPVRIATTANHGLTGLTAVDGVTPVAGDRILVKNQSTGSANGIYVAAAGAWSRATDFAAGSTQYPGTTLFVYAGTVNGDKHFSITSDAVVTVGVTSHTWGQSGGSYTGSLGVQLVGNDIRANLGSGVTLSGDQIIANLGPGVTLSGNQIVPNLGPGVTIVSNQIVANLGTGLVFSGNQIVPDYTKVLRFKVALGFVGTSGVDVTVNHALTLADKSDFLCEVTEHSTGEKVTCKAVGSDVNNVILSFDTAPTSNQYRYQILGLS